MFGNKRKRAQQKIKAIVRPLLGTYQRYHRMPPHAWDDDYFLGFIGGFIYFHLTYTVGEKLYPNDRAIISSEVLTDIPNLNGYNLTQRIDELTLSNPKNRDFEEAFDNAFALGSYGTFGRLPEKWAHLLEAPLKIAEAMGKRNDHGTVVAAFTQIVFFDRVAARLSE